MKGGSAATVRDTIGALIGSEEPCTASRWKIASSFMRFFEFFVLLSNWFSTYFQVSSGINAGGFRLVVFLFKQGWCHAADAGPRAGEPFPASPDADAGPRGFFGVNDHADSASKEFLDANPSVRIDFLRNFRHVGGDGAGLLEKIASPPIRRRWHGSIASASNPNRLPRH